VWDSYIALDRAVHVIVVFRETRRIYNEDAQLEAMSWRENETSPTS